MAVPMTGINFNYSVVPTEYPTFDTNGDFGQQMYAMRSSVVPMTTATTTTTAPVANTYVTAPTYSYGTNAASIFATQQDYQQQQNKYNAPYLAMQDKFAQLSNAIVENDQEAVQTRYNEALTVIKQMNPNMTDAEARAQLKQYFAASTGTDLIAAIKANGDTDAEKTGKEWSLWSFVSGDYKQDSANDTIRKIEGTQKTKKEIAEEKKNNIVQGAGTVAQGLGAAAVVVGAIACPPAAIIGGAVFGISTLIKHINRKK